MKVLITGVTSFLGVYTALQLLEKDYEVIGAVRPDSKNEEVLDKRGITGNPHYKTVYMDFDKLPEPELGEEHFAELVERTMDEAPVIDAWIHFAWDGIGSAGRENTDIQIQNNRHRYQGMHEPLSKGLGHSCRLGLAIVACALGKDRMQ